MKEPLTLGKLTDKLKAIPNEKNEVVVRYDFGTAIPTDFDSWRGSYDQLELGYQLTGYDVLDSPDLPKLSELIRRCEAANGATYTGWKGGDYTMDSGTSVWASNPGNASNSAIVGVRDLEYGYVVLETAYCE